jgi:hypothetical protein
LGDLTGPDRVNGLKQLLYIEKAESQDKTPLQRVFNNEVKRDGPHGSSAMARDGG